MKTLGSMAGVSMYALLVGALSLGCGGVCEKMADFEMECGKFKGKEELRPLAVTMCKKALESEKVPQGLQDSKECAEAASDCAEFSACKAKKKAAKTVARLKEGVAKGEFIGPLGSCDANNKDFTKSEALKTACFDAVDKALTAFAEKNDSYAINRTCAYDWVAGDEGLAGKCATAVKASLETFRKEEKYYNIKRACTGDMAKSKTGKKACDDVLADSLKDVTAKLAAIRDGKQPDKKVFNLCSNLKTIGEALGGDQKKQGEALCAEAKAGASAKKAKDKIAEQMKKPKMQLPYQCKGTIKKLHELAPSAWQKKAKAELIELCYVKLGGKILAAEVPNMRFCSFSIKSVLEGIDTYKVANPALDANVAAARAKCKK